MGAGSSAPVRSNLHLYIVVGAGSLPARLRELRDNHIVCQLDAGRQLDAGKLWASCVSIARSSFGTPHCLLAWHGIGRQQSIGISTAVRKVCLVVV